jgi:alanyl-tRNA synthetase
MLHHTLRALVGEHVRQMGSYVEPGRLRFDFSHFEALAPGALDEVEETVNRHVLDDDPVRWFETSYQEAVRGLGAIAFFEEKYGDEVRVVQIGEWSRELCGGTHVGHTGRVGMVKLVSETSIGSNLRRVEALTGLEGLRWVNDRLRTLERAADLARVPPEEMVDGVERLLRTQKDLQRAVEDEQRRRATSAVDDLLKTQRTLGKGRLLVARRTDDLKTLQMLAVSLRDRLDRGLVILGTEGEGRVNLVAAAAKGLVSEGIDARAILRAGAAHIGGGAGGKPDLATAGGGRPEGLDEALAAAAAEAEGLLA